MGEQMEVYMTQNDYNVIKGVLKPFEAGGLITAGCIDEIKTLTVKDINNAPAQTSKLTEYVNRKEAAVLVGVSERTIIRWGQLGILINHKLGGRRLSRYKISELENLIPENQ